jgi:hypothetical protein
MKDKLWILLDAVTMGRRTGLSLQAALTGYRSPY